jgi:hypothetical protein
MINMWKHHIPFGKEHFLLLLNAYLFFADAQICYELDQWATCHCHSVNPKPPLVFQSASHCYKSHQTHSYC